MALQWQRRALCSYPCSTKLLLLVLVAVQLRLVRFAAAVAQCDIAPLTLSWSNTTVSESGLAVTRGIEVGIGTPNQIFAFRPSTSLNNTRINNVLSCVSARNDSCVGGVGGVFDPSASSTYSVSIRSKWNGSQIDSESDTGAYVYFNDFVGFQRNGEVDGFPLVMDSEPGGGPQSTLPLGTNSSFLRAAVMGSVAPSTAFGLWTGSRSLAPVDGLLVIGGYDSNRVNGSFVDFKIREWNAIQPCPLQVNITDIAYGGESLFSNGTQSFTACIDMSVQRNVFTPEIAMRFGNVTRQNSALYKGMTYPADGAPAGNMTITLSNGYKTTIPNNELFNLFRGSDEYGRYAVTNNTIVEAGVADNRASNPQNVHPVLGGLFLTFNYLVVDYETGIWRLAPAKRSDAQVGGTTLETICHESPSPSVTPTPTPEPSNSKNVGAIAGGTVGGVAGVALIGSLLFFFLRRRRKQQQERKASMAQSEVVQSPVTPSAELPADSHFPPQELPTSKPSIRRPRAGTPTSNDPDDDLPDDPPPFDEISPASPEFYRDDVYRR